MPRLVFFLALTGCFPQDGRQSRGFSIDLTPDAPVSADALELTIHSDSPEHAITWTVNGVDRPEWDDLTHISADQTLPGQHVEVRVQALWMGLRGSIGTDAVTIVNTEPHVGEAWIIPDRPRVGDTLEAKVGAAHDFDGADVKIRYRWTVNGVDVPQARGRTLDDAHWGKDDAVVVLATPFDGEVAGKTVASEPVIIVNTMPTLQGAAVSPSPATALSALRCEPIGADDADGDTLTYRASWQVNQFTVSGTPTPLPGDQVSCALRADDGEDLSPQVHSASVPIVNIPPSISSVAISPSSPTEQDVLTATSQGWHDVDSTSQPSFLYAWYVNGAEVASTPTLTGASFDKGDEIWLRVTPFDGISSGPSHVSDSVIAVNTPPTFQAVNIQPFAPLATSTLWARTTGWVDPDRSDAEAYLWSWAVNGTPVATTATLPPSQFVSGDLVTVTATATDGEPGSVHTHTVEIDNSPPSAPGVSVSPVEPEAGEALTCAISSPATDIDGDAITYELAWFVDDLETPYSATTSDTATTLDVPAGQTQDAEIWTCEVTADDGVAAHSAEHSVVVGDPCGGKGVLQMNPLAYWPLDDTSTVAVDATGNGWDGVRTNLTVAAGHDGTLACGGSRFSGSTSSRVRRDGFQLPPDRASVSMWVRADSTRAAGLFNLVGGPGNSNDFTVFKEASGEVCPIFGATFYCTTASLADGQWHHLVTTFSGQRVALYFDGVVVLDSPVTDGHTIASSGVLMLGQEQDCPGGCLDGNQAHLGMLDEVVVFDRVLTATEATRLYTLP